MISVQKYDDENPIKDPTTGKVLSNHSIIAPAPSKAKGQPLLSPERLKLLLRIDLTISVRGRLR